LNDASALVEANALVQAAKHFADDNVGVVCGTYRLIAGSEGEMAYWDYQTQVKADEAALAAPMGAHGAFYLFRRSLWLPLPADTINDDFILPMRIVLQGYRAVYDPLIVAMELERSCRKHEFRRRMRIGAGNLQQVLRLAGLGNPRRGYLAFVFLSGKALRAIMPFIGITALVTTALLAIDGPAIYSLLLACEIAALSVPLASLLLDEANLPRPVAWLSYLVTGYAAATIGSLFLLAGKEKKIWRLSTAKKAQASPELGDTFDPVPIRLKK
jgi:cellulose synthase/poly-beta-1,6-N-acetylglucosamine synthase-like glycosyltransferase